MSAPRSAVKVSVPPRQATQARWRPDGAAEAQANHWADAYLGGRPVAEPANAARPVRAGQHPLPLGGGEALPAATRTRMEKHFGADFSTVRVHTGDSAARAAHAVRARAYSLGDDLVFNRGEYAPGAWAGQRVLAHELAHVVQQRVAGAPHLHRLSYEEDSSARTLTAQYAISLAFIASSREAWTPAREEAFMAGTRDAIQNAFNANTYRIAPLVASVPYTVLGVDVGSVLGLDLGRSDCPCTGTGFSPRIAVDVSRGGISSRHGDWNASVMANPAGAAHRSSAAPGSEAMGSLDEADIRQRHDQTAVVHEFGHAIGLNHPGTGVSGITPNSRADYAHTGRDAHGRAVAGSDLMGEGSGLRPFYFDRWVAHLNSEHGGCGYSLTTASAATTPATSGAGATP